MVVETIGVVIMNEFKERFEQRRINPAYLDSSKQTFETCHDSSRGAGLTRDRQIPLFPDA